MAHKITRQKLDSFIEKHASDKKVLDVGSGGSSYGKFFPNRVTVDIDIASNPDIVADIHNLPFKDEEFEMILCTEVLEHAKSPQLAINELRRVLAPGGKLILTTRFVYPLHDTPNDFWRFTKYGLAELFKDWEIEEMTYETKTFSALAALIQRACFQTKFKFNKPVKAILFALIYIFSKIDFLILEEFGDIRRENKDAQIMTTGYYLVAFKN